MITCDCCGTRIARDAVKASPLKTRQDPYGEDSDWCETCALKAHGRIQAIVANHKAILDEALTLELLQIKEGMQK